MSLHDATDKRILIGEILIELLPDHDVTFTKIQTMQLPNINKIPFSESSNKLRFC
jgi:hypothetical protein